MVSIWQAGHKAVQHTLGHLTDPDLVQGEASIRAFITFNENHEP